MVTQGKFQVNAVDTVEGKDFLWSSKSVCFTFTVIIYTFFFFYLLNKWESL